MVLRTALEISRAIASKLAAFQARAAAALAARESHGDGGAGVLRHSTGVSRRQAEGQARAVRILDGMPVLRDALEAGKVSFANAARLADAAEATSADAVQADAELLSKAESMPDDLFSREARRWAARHQPDGGEAGYARRRARRWLRIWDGEDGMTHLRGELDPVTGERVRNRLEAEARRVRQTDPRDERHSRHSAVARHYQADCDRRPAQGAHRSRRRLCRLRLPSRTVPGPSHQARLAGRADHHLQHGAAVLELPQQGPSPPVDGHTPPWTVRAAAPGANPLGPGPRSRSPGRATSPGVAGAPGRERLGPSQPLPLGHRIRHRCRPPSRCSPSCRRPTPQPGSAADTPNGSTASEPVTQRRSPVWPSSVS